jgi:hypothetical protein
MNVISPLEGMAAAIKHDLVGTRTGALRPCHSGHRFHRVVRTRRLPGDAVQGACRGPVDGERRRLALRRPRRRGSSAREMERTADREAAARPEDPPRSRAAPATLHRPRRCARPLLGLPLTLRSGGVPLDQERASRQKRQNFRRIETRWLLPVTSKAKRPRQEKHGPYRMPGRGGKGEGSASRCAGLASPR